MKICILAAGRGTRAVGLGPVPHKALLPLGNKAVLSRIIEQFPYDSEFVIAVGHSKDDIIDYITIAHPERSVRYSVVDNFDGSGSGPGWSLLCCSSLLQEPFIFTSCDTLVHGDAFSLHDNWIGVSPAAEPERWCTAEVTDAGDVRRLFDKSPHGSSNAFIGIAGVKDYRLFWNALADEGAADGKERQVVSGLQALVARGLKARIFGWSDTGSSDTYLNALSDFEKNYTFTGKTTDCTYHVGDRIIKYFDDPEVAKRRYLRGQDNKHVFGEVLSLRNRFYAYRFEEGTPLSHGLTYDSCRSFLEWAEGRLWSDVNADCLEFQANCRRFYFDKTISRLRTFLQRYMPSGERDAVVINGVTCRPAVKMVQGLPDACIVSGLPSTFHGDLHADNIIRTSDGYRLIDWRDSFSESVSVGDRYYDLAKYLHVLDFSVEAMEQGQYSVSMADADEIAVDHQARFTAIEARDAFWSHARDRGYNVARIQLVNALIFLNMACLYEEKLATYLYYFGRYLLQRVVNENNAYQ